MLDTRLVEKCYEVKWEEEVFSRFVKDNNPTLADAIIMFDNNNITIRQESVISKGQVTLFYFKWHNVDILFDKDKNTLLIRGMGKRGFSDYGSIINSPFDRVYICKLFVKEEQIKEIAEIIKKYLDKDIL